MNLQNRLLQAIKASLPKKSTFVHDLAEILSTSTDSAYRRIRGETELTLSEISKLCDYYDLSLDSLLKKDSNHYGFRMSDGNAGLFNYSKYVNSVVNDLEQLGNFKAYDLIFSAKDFPFFYHFLFPEIAEFKGFFWEKTIFQSIENKKFKFRVDDLNKERVALGNKISDMYAQIPCSELWNDEVFNSILSQIKFYHESNFIATDRDTEALLDAILRLIDHFEVQAEHGCKFLRDQAPKHKKARFDLYYNDVIIGHNNVLFDYHGHKRLYVAHNIINSLFTDDQVLCNSSWDLHRRLMASANLISGTSERLRIKFFNRLRKKVNNTKMLLLD